MLNVQKYLIENGLQKLQDEFHISVRDYPEMVVLNYSQIDSPKNHPITNECRGLILKKGTWEVVARSFTRFLNVGEDPDTGSFPITKSKILTKLDGSLISVYFFDNKWNASSRSMAFGEGQTNIGITFNQLFMGLANKTSLWSFLDESSDYRNYTWAFEMATKFNRVVTPYPIDFIALIGARNKITDQELTSEELDSYAKIMHVSRPESFSFKTLEEVKNAAESLPTLQEGFVLVYENGTSFWRLKCKSSKYLAISHMRGQGGIPTAKNILRLVMANETEEYCSYFPEDKPIFDFVGGVYSGVINNINTLWNETKDIKDQKEFALTIMPRTKYPFEAGVLFSARKYNSTIAQEIAKVDSKKLSKSLGLKEQVAKQFGIMAEED